MTILESAMNLKEKMKEQGMDLHLSKAIQIVKMFRCVTKELKNKKKEKEIV